MTRTWQQTHNHIFKRAQMLYAEINGVFDGMTAPGMAKLLYSQKKGEPATRTLCRMLRKRLDTDIWKATEAVQVHGMFGPLLHSWFKIGPDAETLAQTGDEQIQPNYHYYIDPQCPEVTPQVLMISPHSPVLLNYLVQEEKSCLEYLKTQK